MLIEFFGENFRCFRDEFRLSMLATGIDPDSNRGTVSVQVNGDPEPLRLLRAAAIYGANASGKSAVLQAAQALSYLMLLAGRFRSDEPIRVYEPFAGAEAMRKPVRLGLKAVVNGDVYDYEASFNDRQVLSERREQHVEGDWTHDEQFMLIGKEFRPNALLLSLADSLTPRLARGIAPALARLLDFHDGSGIRAQLAWSQPAARLAAQDSKFRDWLLRQLRSADVGVFDLTVRRQRRTKEEGQATLFEEIADDSGETSSPREASRYSFTFSHAGPEGLFLVPFESESYGTRKVVELAPVLYSLFSQPQATASFVDEIGASLHPVLLSGLIRHINCEARPQTAQGQLIFATHELSLIDDEARDAILRRDQVYFTEKDSQGVARLYSLAEFKERQNMNLRKRYLEGRYGAIPALGHFPS
jgi:hypothetical protein